MRTRVLLLSILVCIAGFVLAPANAEESGKYIAKVAEVSGDAQYREKGEADWKPVVVGIQLREGDKVRTKLASKIKIEFVDRSEVWLRENSIMDIKLLRDTRLGDRQRKFKMWIGDIRAKVSPLPTEESAFEVFTPTSVAGVRGTDFSVSVKKDGSTRLYVREGKVVFKNLMSAKSVTVGQSEQSTSTAQGDVSNPEKSEDPDKDTVKKTDQDGSEPSSSNSSSSTASNTGPDTETTSADNDNGAKTEETVKGTLVLSEPSNGLVTTSKSVKVSGSYASGKKVYINDQAVLCSGDGFFSSSLTLSEGENRITVTNDDRSQSSEVTVTVDTVKPTITITSTIPQITNQAFLNLSLSTEANSTIQVGSVSQTSSSGIFSTQVSLTEGVNNITIIVTDKAGNTAEKTITVELDSIAPSLIISQIIVDKATGNLIVQGTVEKGASVTANGYPLEVRSDGSFYDVISWVTGQDVTFEAKDRAGNINREVRNPSGSVDNSAPTLTSLTFNPTTATVGTDNSVQVTITAADESDLAASTNITLSGPTGRTITGTLSLSGTKQYAGSLFIPTDIPGGIYSVSQLILADALGNSASAGSSNSLTIVNWAPKAPSNVSAVDLTTGGKARITWSFGASESDLAGLRLYRSFASGGPYNLIANLSSGSTLYDVNNLVDGTPYYFIVRSYDFAGNESLNSNEASVTPSDQQAPNPPTSLNGSSASNSVTLSWSAGPGEPAAAFKIYRSLSASGGDPYALIGQTASTSFTVNGLASGQTYHFAVTALDDNSAPPNGSPNESSKATVSITTQ